MLSHTINEHTCDKYRETAVH